jgi:hypothetical protein
MRAAAAYNKPSNRLEPSPISSPDSFILTVPHPLPLTLTAATVTSARRSRTARRYATTRVQAQVPNQSRLGTHLPRKVALNRPSFLIHCPELDTELSYTKQKLAPISNRQFFAFLKLPDTSLIRSGPYSSSNRYRIALLHVREFAFRSSSFVFRLSVFQRVNDAATLLR